MQIREPDLAARELQALVRACIDASGSSGCRIIVNDRVDIAIAAGANGVHLREASITVDDARRVASASRPSRNFTVGRSVHDPATAASNRAADYLILGSVFPTASKVGRHPTLGRDGLRRVVEAASPCPVWAVGGITAERVTDLVGCGVDGVAAIGALLPSPNATHIEHEVQRLTESLRISLASL